MLTRRDFLRQLMIAMAGTISGAKANWSKSIKTERKSRPVYNLSAMPSCDGWLEPDGGMSYAERAIVDAFNHPDVIHHRPDMIFGYPVVFVDNANAPDGNPIPELARLAGAALAQEEDEAWMKL